MKETFNKTDFLTAHEYATKHGLSVDVVERAIAELKGVVTPGRKKPIVVKLGSRGSAPRINPESAAQEIFKQKIEQIQKRGK